MGFFRFQSPLKGLPVRKIVESNNPRRETLGLEKVESNNPRRKTLGLEKRDYRFTVWAREKFTVWVREKQIRIYSLC